MARRAGPSKTGRSFDTSDPHGMGACLVRYLEWLRVHNYSEWTVANRDKYLGFLIEWCEMRSVTKPHEVTKPLLERYQRYLFHYRKPNGKPLTFGAQFARMVPVRHFFRWLAKQNVLLWNPASDLEMPRMEKRLPKYVLTPSEAETVLAVPDVHEPLGLRDRAILETLYSTGLRRLEIIRLGVFDIDSERGTLMVRQGKGKKDRMVPIGERAVMWIDKYVREVRPGLVVAADDGVLFLTQEGEPLSRVRLSQMARDYIRRAEVGKTGACHLFRHTMATAMLENGADIRYIQEMLGHAELSTTQIYTQVSIRRLKAVHTLTHPSAKLGRKEAAESRGEEEVEHILSLAADSVRGGNGGAQASSALTGDAQERDILVDSGGPTVRNANEGNGSIESFEGSATERSLTISGRIDNEPNSVVADRAEGQSARVMSELLLSLAEEADEEDEELGRRKEADEDPERAG
jgi:integrase/recombinase XerD